MRTTNLFSFVVGALAFAGSLAAVGTCRAEVTPELSAGRVIELTPIDTKEEKPVISSVAIDPSGKWLAAVGDDHMVRILDASNGRVLHRWASHADWVRATAFRPDGLALATSGADRRVCFWEIAAESKPRRLPEPLSVIYSIAYSPDGQTLAAAGFSDRIWLFDGLQGRLIREMAAPGADIRALAFSSDGSQLAAAGRAGIVRIWTVADGRQVRDIAASNRRVSALAYSPDGTTLAVAGQQRIVRLFDTHTGAPMADLPERPGENLAICFCGPGLLASAGSGNDIHLWNLAAQAEQCRLTGHTGSVTTLVFEPMEGTLFSGSFDTTVRLWDIKKANPQKITKR